MYVTHGPDIEPDMEGAEQTDYIKVILEPRLRIASGQLNPDLGWLEVVSHCPSQRWGLKITEKIDLDVAFGIIFPSLQKQSKTI